MPKVIPKLKTNELAVSEGSVSGATFVITTGGIEPRVVKSQQIPPPPFRIPTLATLYEQDDLSVEFGDVGKELYDNKVAWVNLDNDTSDSFNQVNDELVTASNRINQVEQKCNQVVQVRELDLRNISERLLRIETIIELLLSMRRWTKGMVTTHITLDEFREITSLPSPTPVVSWTADNAANSGNPSNVYVGIGNTAEDTDIYWKLPFPSSDKNHLAKNLSFATLLRQSTVNVMEEAANVMPNVYVEIQNGSSYPQLIDVTPTSVGTTPPSMSHGTYVCILGDGRLVYNAHKDKVKLLDLDSEHVDDFTIVNGIYMKPRENCPFDLIEVTYFVPGGESTGGIRYILETEVPSYRIE